MAHIYSQKMAAEIEGDFVVFLIGMRINKPWKIHKWLPVFLAMGPMLKELDANPESGCLGYTMSFNVIVQYWRSFDHLEAYARSRNQKHWPAWINFYKKIGGMNGDVGIWHETYKVAPGQYETVYGNMPAIGLGKAREARLIPAKEMRDTARGRLEATTESETKVTAETN